jgi:hypothetical protein
MGWEAQPLFDLSPPDVVTGGVVVADVAVQVVVAALGSRPDRFPAADALLGS